MLKSKMTRILARNFAIALLVFATFMSGTFLFLHRDQTLKNRQNDLLSYGETLANTIKNEISSNNKLNLGQMRQYLFLASDLALSDIWLIDLNFKVVKVGKMGHHMMGQQNQLNDLSTEAMLLVKNVMAGTTIVTEDFSSSLKTRSLSVGVPIINENNMIVGAVLLHAPIRMIYQTADRDFIVFFLSAVIGFLVALSIALVLSYRFTRPLKTLQYTASSLALGNYDVATNLKQNDEIGDLALKIDDLAVKLQEASMQREHLDQLRQDFITNISHELKTPLAVIRGSFEALYDGVIEDPKQIENYRKEIMNEIKYLERLVLDLLELSRLRNIDYKIEKRPVNLNDLLLDVARSGNQLALKSQKTIKVKIDNNQKQISGDYGRLRQMLLIVVDNAIKYAPFQSEIILELNKDEISVIDHGPGIEDSKLEVVFERFYQTREKQVIGSTGLGLPIAQEIAKRHQIEIKLENIKPTGLKVTFFLKKQENLI